MGKYVLKRFGSMLITLFLIATVTFFLMHLIPGDPFALPRDTPEIVRENLEEKYGLDKPLFEQYTIYMKNLLHGDFGSSMKYKGQTVVGKVTTGMPPSALVGFGGVIIGSIIGLVLGCIAALNNKGKVDYLVIILAILGVSIPSFVFGSLIQKIFGVDLKLFPIQGWKGVSYVVLPMMTAAFTNIAFYARMLRTSMLDVMKQDYTYTAKSKGLTKTEIVKRHMLRNSLLPLVTSFGPMCAGVLTGNFVVEKIFNIPGIGQAMISAIQSSDYTMIMGLTVIFSFISAIMYFVVDILYGVVDPRIRIAG
ncbi:ABC transporter permease [Sellimonas caecigallum]|uniref:ABC transporter permease n=1 Tax=Sellimonas caecigallum TaxID=2592333 RepID=A0ABS7L7Q6_9FIRM|nr:ABC transporter permease [Sellimonas caecigallum]MBY0759128.1 ABC transporter permease [Sellimonas caecigallum]